MKIHFPQANFVKSCLEEKDYPSSSLPEIAFVGRSNVGKSSLINHLTDKKHLVFVSSTPGKTQLINFFTIDEKFLLVDLPGYGFAKVPKGVKQHWGKALQTYLEKRSQLRLIILLLDLRRDISTEDEQMIDWAISRNKPLLLVFTKHDKLSSSERTKAEKRLIDQLNQLFPSITLPHLSYSIKEGSCKLAVRHFLSTFLDTPWDSSNKTSSSV